MKNILIDTDVLMDFLCDRVPFCKDAGKILTLCENKNINGHITPLMLSNIYYLLRKFSTHEKVIDSLKNLISIVDIAIIDRTSVVNALESNFKDFEDALQNFSHVSEYDFDVIVTRNTKDFKTSKISVMNPEIFLKSVKF